MRPLGRSQLDSLYFDYPLFSAGEVPADEPSDLCHPVIIVGGGPVGMTAALTLARHGVRSVVLEQKNTFNDGSRAICISRSSLHILQRLGVAEPFLRKSLGWVSGRSFYRGREILKFDMPHSDDERFLPMYNLQQQYIEQYLYDAIAQSDLIDMRWETSLVGIAESAGQVRLEVETPAGNYALNALHVLAADGARSKVRTLCNLRLNGDNLEGRYIIADVQMDHDYPTERRALFESAANPGGTVLIHKQPDNIWRIDYQINADEDSAVAMQEVHIRARVRAILAEIEHEGAWELEWWSMYAANTLCLDEYRHGRVSFIGDSAHIVPIFGVRGLNNGLADAENIGWKLARVLRGQAEEALLDSYTPERRGATLDVFANARKSAAFMTPPTRGHALMRKAALSLSLRHGFARQLANPRSMVPYTYSESPLTRFPQRDLAFEAGPACGAACCNVRLGEDNFLLDHVGVEHTILVFTNADNGAETDSLSRRLKAQMPDIRMLTIGVGEGLDIQDPEGRIAAAFGASIGTCYLLRPDHHVAGRWMHAVAEEIVETLSLACEATANE